MRVFLAIFIFGLSPLWAAPDELWIAEAESLPSTEVDAALRPYASASLHALGLTGLRLIDTEKEPLEPGQSSTAKFKGGYAMEVRCVERLATQYVLDLTLADKDGPILKTRVEIARNSPIVLAGPTAADGRLLFFVVIR